MAGTLKIQATRLVATREALGFAKQSDFCREIGVEKNVYNPFEKAKRPITIAVARKIKRRFGISLDWTLDGDSDLLPAHLYRKLGQIAA